MDLLTPRELAGMLKVTPAHVYRMASRRSVPFLKIGGSLRFDPSAIDLWLKRKSVSTVSAVLKEQTTGRPVSGINLNRDILRVPKTRIKKGKNK